MKVLTVDRFGNERTLDERIAKVLQNKGKLTYQTRMLEAGPAPDAPDEPEVELDSEGNAWDEKLHVSTKLKNQNGTWRKKPGASSAE